MQENTVQTKDGKMFYRQQGKGEPLILIHTAGLSSELWLTTMGPLVKKFNVYAPDLIGHGDLDKPDKKYLMRDHARRIFEFMDAVGVKQARIVGSSIGAMISIEMSTMFPERVLKQVLIAVPLNLTDWESREGMMRMAHRYDEQFNNKPLTAEGLKMTFVHPTQEIVDFSNRLRAKAGIWTFRDQITIRGWKGIPLLSRIKCPTLVIYGRKDGLSRKMPVLMQKIKGAQSAWIEDANHFPQIEQPKALIETILKIL